MTRDLDDYELSAIWASERGRARIDIAGFRVAEIIAFELNRDPRVMIGRTRAAIDSAGRLAIVFALHRYTNAALYQVVRLLGRSRRTVVALLWNAEARYEDDGEFQRLARVVAQALEAA